MAGEQTGKTLVNEEAAQLAQILDTVGERVPALINALKGTLYSVQAGRELGQAVGAFYQELIAAGIANDPALQMTTKYMGILSGMMQQAPAQSGMLNIGQGEFSIKRKGPHTPDEPDVEDVPKYR